MEVWVILVKLVLQTQAYTVSGVMRASPMIKSHSPVTGMGEERRVPSQREFYTLRLGSKGEGGELSPHLLFLK